MPDLPLLASLAGLALAGYALACALVPFGPCRRCHDTDPHCRACDGTGPGACGPPPLDLPPQPL